MYVYKSVHPYPPLIVIMLQNMQQIHFISTYIAHIIKLWHCLQCKTNKRTKNIYLYPSRQIYTHTKTQTPPKQVKN